LFFGCVHFSASLDEQFLSVAEELTPAFGDPSLRGMKK
jgi:hypothetical protein